MYVETEQKCERAKDSLKERQIGKLSARIREGRQRRQGKKGKKETEERDINERKHMKISSVICFS